MDRKTDLNTKLENFVPAARLRAEQHAAQAAAIRLRGPRRTIGPVAPSVQQANMDEVDRAPGGHELAAKRWKERAETAEQQKCLADHGSDPEAREFVREHLDLYNHAAREGRVRRMNRIG
jgi:hypothetical protein